MAAPEQTPAGSALVTGASRGIGAAIARGLAADGWHVGVNYRADREGAEGIASEISGSGGSATAIQADVTDSEAVDGLFSELEEAHGPVLVLVNNAGTRADALSPMIDDEAWERVIETNLSAAFRTTRRALRPMIRARFGRVINVASVVGPRANPGQANYAASKAGLIGLTRTVASEVAKRSVTVNAIAPGFVQTELTEGVMGPEVLERIPAGRPGTTEEVAACARFLASPGAAYVTGVTLTVDGGMTA
ncbi:MAG: 3-oxoacyl-ACP reductase FabG [Solirubrobacterales bacterium]